jgi:hypothetical protein
MGENSPNLVTLIGPYFRFRLSLLQKSGFFAGAKKGLAAITACLARTRVTRDRCYVFLNIFAKKIGEKIGIFGQKQS